MSALWILPAQNFLLAIVVDDFVFWNNHTIKLHRAGPVSSAGGTGDVSALERSFSDFKSFVAALVGNFGRILSQSAGFRPIEQIHIHIHSTELAYIRFGLFKVCIFRLLVV